jgi:hypothetical protein
VCPTQGEELFAAGTEPTDPSLDVHRLVRICTVTGQLATEFCPENTVVEKYFEVWPPGFQQWVEKTGGAQPPTETCSVHTFAPVVNIEFPEADARLTQEVDVVGTVKMPDLSHYVVEYTPDGASQAWKALSPAASGMVERGLLARWDTHALVNGKYILRVRAFDHHDNTAEAQVTVQLLNPTLTATRTSTATRTPTPTRSPAPSLTRTPVTPKPSATEQAPRPTSTAEGGALPSPTPTQKPGNRH